MLALENFHSSSIPRIPSVPLQPFLRISISFHPSRQNTMFFCVYLQTMDSLILHVSYISYHMNISTPLCIPCSNYIWVDFQDRRLIYYCLYILRPTLVLLLISLCTAVLPAIFFQGGSIKEHLRSHFNLLARNQRTCVGDTKSGYF